MNIKENDGRFLKPAGDRKMRRAWNELGRRYSKMKYNKLVCDKIPDKLRRKGEDYKIKKLGRKKFETELLKKIKEEASGLLAAKTKDEFISELADILIVIEEVKRVKHISRIQMKKALRENLKKKGGFRKRFFLVWASTKDGYKTNES